MHGKHDIGAEGLYRFKQPLVQLCEIPIALLIPRLEVLNFMPKAQQRWNERCEFSTKAT